MAENYIRAESTNDLEEGTKLTWTVSAAQIVDSPLNTRSSQTSALYSFPINKQNVSQTAIASKVSDVCDNAGNDDVFWILVFSYRVTFHCLSLWSHLLRRRW